MIDRPTDMAIAHANIFHHCTPVVLVLPELVTELSGEMVVVVLVFVSVVVVVGLLLPDESVEVVVDVVGLFEPELSVEVDVVTGLFDPATDESTMFSDVVVVVDASMPADEVPLADAWCRLTVLPSVAVILLPDTAPLATLPMKYPAPETTAAGEPARETIAFPTESAPSAKAPLGIGVGSRARLLGLNALAISTTASFNAAVV